MVTNGNCPVKIAKKAIVVFDNLFLGVFGRFLGVFQAVQYILYVIMQKELQNRWLLKATCLYTLYIYIILAVLLFLWKVLLTALRPQ